MILTETGEQIYARTYSRPKPDGTKESWPETVERVVDGNLALVDRKHELPGEREDLIQMMNEFKLVPAGRHLWATGVPGRQFLFNCWVSGWTENPTDHFEFTFLRLMEGGGVGANYSNRFLEEYPEVLGYFASEDSDAEGYAVEIVCDPEHPDYQKMRDAGVLSEIYDHEWAGSFEIEDSREGWAAALVDLINTYYRPAANRHRVFDVSRVRGEGARLKTFGGRASGPLPLATMLHEVAEVLNRLTQLGDGVQLDGISAMEIDHAIATCVVSGGNRRSARMSIMRWDDPQIEQFLTAKAATGKHWTTNISVEVNDEFWVRVNAGRPDATFVLSAITEGMHANGEPGFWDSDLSNDGEPNEVICTNPCGEIVLEPWEPCCLGHVNLAAFIDSDGLPDVEDMEYAHRLMTRFLIRATFADVNDPKSREVLDRNRRIGVGHLGVASALAMTGIKYSEAPDSGFEDTLGDLAQVVDDEAVKYSHDLRIPVPVKKRTVAPTGTIAKLCGVSEGVHPIFSKYFVRRVRFSDVDPDQVAQVQRYRDKGYGVEPCQYAPATTVVSIPTKDTLMAEVEARFPGRSEEIVEGADDLTMYQMLVFQAMYQDVWADNAVSYTVNFDPSTLSTDEIAEELTSWQGALKGATLFPDQSMPQSPYSRITKAEWDLVELWNQTIADGVDENCASGACPIK